MFISQSYEVILMENSPNQCQKFFFKRLSSNDSVQKKKSILRRVFFTQQCHFIPECYPYLVFHISTHMRLGFIRCYLNSLIKWKNSTTLLYLRELSLFSSAKLWRRRPQKSHSLEGKLVLLNLFDKGDEHSNANILE